MSDDLTERTQIERAIARTFSGRTRMSRRAFFRQAGRGGVYAGAALSLPAILAACGIGSPSPRAAPSRAPGGGGTPTGALDFANWPLPIDKDDDGHPPPPPPLPPA